MALRSPRRAMPGPSQAAAARSFAAMLRNPLDGYVSLAARYGDTIRVPVSRRLSFYILSRPEQAEHVLATGQDNYVKAFTYRPLRALIGNGLLTSEGEQWRQRRRLLQPQFTRPQVAATGPQMAAAICDMLSRWDHQAAGAPVLNVAAEMGALALDIVGRVLFGADLSAESAQMRRAMAVGQKVAVLATFTPLQWGPVTSRALRTMTERIGRTEGIDGPVKRMIAARRAVLGGTGPDARPATPDNMLDVLLAARHPDGRPLTDTEIGDEVATFMVAGHETSAGTLSWSLALLSAYPAARERLEAEVDARLGGAIPSPADLPQLPWTRAVMAEAMRLYPPAWTVERDALADDEVAGVHVPAGSMVAVPPYLVHRHPEFWPDPAGFDPRRFLPDGPERHRYSYIPFGGGRRACIGSSFAEQETTLVLAAIAGRFRLELTAGGMPVPSANVTLRPRRALPMRLLRRQR
ncbi:MAG TPA: cytochrome P450 [Streptosporangiaceae bacterium]